MQQIAHAALNWRIARERRRRESGVVHFVDGEHSLRDLESSKSAINSEQAEGIGAGAVGFSLVIYLLRLIPGDRRAPCPLLGFGVPRVARIREAREG
jgi:hypothetical protein